MHVDLLMQSCLTLTPLPLEVFQLRKAEHTELAPSLAPRTLSSAPGLTCRGVLLWFVQTDLCRASDTWSCDQDYGRAPNRTS